MNATSLKTFVNYIILILLLFNIVNCMPEGDKLKISGIVNTVQVDGKNYEYSEDSHFEINGLYYSKRTEASYDDNGVLKLFTLYKSEGKLEYEKQDIDGDKAIIEFSGLPLKQGWAFEHGKLKKGDNIINVEMINDSLIKTNEGKKVTFFKLK